MKIKLYENYGNFNLMNPSEYTTKFSVYIDGDDGKTITDGEIPCKLFWEEDGELKGKYSLSDGIPYLAQQSWNFSNRVWGTTDYKAQTLAFVRFFNRNKDALLAQHESDRKETIRKEIEQLERSLEWTELDDESVDIADLVKNEVALYNKWIASCEDKLSQLKEGTALYNEEVTNIQNYKTKLASLTSSYTGI